MSDRVRGDYRRIKGAGRLRIMPDAPSGTAELTAKCRVMLSRRFPILARLKFLFTGRMWVAAINCKEHTQIILTMRQPRDQEIAAKQQQDAAVLTDVKKSSDQVHYGARFRG